MSAIPQFPGILESTREGSNPYVNVKENNGIYVGPLLHFSIEKNGYVKNLKENKLIEKSKLK
ncbi:hypothetical protein M4I42_12870, partial [Anoxybacillus sp. J5B_2022]|nr:hypothetical protein [Anoxybacillus sp. J5B_2022]